MARSSLAADSKVEERQIPCPLGQLQTGTDRPNFLELQRSLPYDCASYMPTTSRPCCVREETSYSATCSGTISFGSPVSSASSRTGALLVAFLHSRRQLICPSPVWFQKATKRHALTADDQAGIQLPRGNNVPGREAPDSSQSVTIAALGECRKATTFLSPPTDC